MAEAPLDRVVNPVSVPRPTADNRAAALPAKGRRGLLSKALFIALLITFTVLFIYPFIWLLSGSLKTTTEVFSNTLIPNPPHWENYTELTKRAPILNWTWNSLIVSILAAVTV